MPWIFEQGSPCVFGQRLPAYPARASSRSGSPWRAAAQTCAHRHPQTLFPLSPCRTAGRLISSTDGLDGIAFLRHLAVAMGKAHAAHADFGNLQFSQKSCFHRENSFLCCAIAPQMQGRCWRSASVVRVVGKIPACAGRLLWSDAGRGNHQDTPAHA